MVKKCKRCSNPINDQGKCKDITCPFSYHDQHCPVGWTGHPMAKYFGPEIDVCTCDVKDYDSDEMDFQGIIDDISDALLQASPEYIAKIHNQICSNKIVVVVDEGTWRDAPDSN